MRTIIIEVRGGVVQDVYADEGTRIVLVDWDEQEAASRESFAGEIRPLPLKLMPEAAEEFIAGCND